MTTETETKPGRGRLKGASASGWTVDEGGFASPPPPTEPVKKARKPRVTKGEKAARAARATKRPAKKAVAKKAPRATKKASGAKRAAKRPSAPKVEPLARVTGVIPPGLPTVGPVIEKPLSPKALNPVVNAIIESTSDGGWVPVTHDGRDPKSLQSALTSTARKMGVKISTSVVEIDGTKTLIAQAG